MRSSALGGGVSCNACRKTCSQPLPDSDEQRLMTERWFSGVHLSTQHTGTKQGQSADGDEHERGGRYSHIFAAFAPRASSIPLTTLRKICEVRSSASSRLPTVSRWTLTFSRAVLLQLAGHRLESPPLLPQPHRCHIGRSTRPTRLSSCAYPKASRFLSGGLLRVNLPSRKDY